MRELNKNAWVFEMTVDESCKNIDDASHIIDDSCRSFNCRGGLFYIFTVFTIVRRRRKWNTYIKK